MYEVMTCSDPVGRCKDTQHFSFSGYQTVVPVPLVVPELVSRGTVKSSVMHTTLIEPELKTVLCH
jgi:hypothetical protein